MKIEIKHNAFGGDDLYVDGKRYVPMDSYMSALVQKVISGSIMIDEISNEDSSVEGVERYSITISLVRRS